MKARHAWLFTLLGLISAWGYTATSFDAPGSSDTRQQFGTSHVQRQDTPNDPDYDCAEPDTQLGNRCSNLYDQRFDLFGFASSLTRSTLYKDPTDTARFGQPQISGFNAAGAWKIERGRPDVSVAILDTGIRWNNSGLRTQVRLNRRELPIPQGCAAPNPADAYDCNNDGAFNVDDYASDTRVNKSAGPNAINGVIDAQDLIRTFSDASDADTNGFVDDIAGWDFFDDDNDPNDASSYFAAGNHGTGRMEEVAERGNDGTGSIGVCPNCQIVPIRIWDTFVSDGNTFGLGILYAADNGVNVIVGANGSLYHSAFTEAASEYAWKKDVVQTYSGDDLNTGNHNYPAAYNHAMLIEGTVPDNQGLGTDNDEFNQAREFFCQFTSTAGCPGSNAPVGTYFRSANTAQFGGKSSISMWGSTGSQNTGRAGGAAGLLISAGKTFLPSMSLSADEARILLEQTAEDVTAPNVQGAGSPDLANPGWDSHFGWGRVNLGAAVQAVKDGNIPPEASINSPDWYAPLTGASVNFSGVARARRAAGFSWKLEWGAGQAPTSWTLVNQGSSSGTVTDFGTLQLAAVRTAINAFVPPLDTGDATFSSTSRHPLKDQFTVRLTVTAPGKMPGIDRKVLTIVPDGQNLVAGYPKRLGSGGEAPIRYADINGDGVQEMIVPVEDGSIHAYQPDGTELPGWPVMTGVFSRAQRHLAAPGFATGGVVVPREPPRGPTIADLDNDGKRQVITAAGLGVYVFNADGTRRDGFPVTGNPDNCTPDKQKQENLHPKCGFVATPVLAWINGRANPPVIAAPSMDGHLYLWNGDGTPVSWSPVRLQDSTIAVAERQVAEAIHNPAVGDLNADGKDDLVVPTNEAYADPGSGPGIPTLPGAPDDVGFGSLGLKSTRVYAINGADGSYLAGWPVRVSGLIQDVLPFIGPNADPALFKLNGAQQVVLSATGTGISGVGSGLSTYSATGVKQVEMQQTDKGAASNITDTSGGINLFESAVIGDLLGAGLPNIVKYQLSRGQVTNLLLVGQNNPYNHMIGAWNPITGTSNPAFPTIVEDYQFLSSSTVAKISATGTTQQVVAGSGLGLVHAYDGATGLDVNGFPKVTGGWLFAPAAINDAGRMAAITREGFLFEWQTNHPSCQSEWPSFRHDEQGSGNYDRDGTPPYGPTLLTATPQSNRSVHVTLRAPGDDYRCGTVARYELRTLNGTVANPQWNDVAAVERKKQAASATVDATETIQVAALPAGSYTLMARAFDEIGNGSPVAFTAFTVTGGGGTPVTPIGSVRTPATPATSGRAGETVSIGDFGIVNNSSSTQTVSSITIRVSDPTLLSALRMRGTGVDIQRSPVTQSVQFAFTPALNVAAGAELVLTLDATLTSQVTASGLEFFNSALAASRNLPASGSHGWLLLLIPLLLLMALPRQRWLGSSALVAVLLVAGCSENHGGSGTAAGGGSGGSRSTTLSVTSVDATADSMAVSYSGLPIVLKTITLE